MIRLIEELVGHTAERDPVADLGRFHGRPTSAEVQPTENPPAFFSIRCPREPRCAKVVEPHGELLLGQARGGRERGTDPPGDRAIGRAPTYPMIDATGVQRPREQERRCVVPTENGAIAWDEID